MNKFFCALALIVTASTVSAEQTFDLAQLASSLGLNLDSFNKADSATSGIAAAKKLLEQAQQAKAPATAKTDLASTLISTLTSQFGGNLGGVFNTFLSSLKQAWLGDANATLGTAILSIVKKLFVGMMLGSGAQSVTKNLLGNLISGSQQATGKALDISTLTSVIKGLGNSDLTNALGGLTSQAPTASIFDWVKKAIFGTPAAQTAAQ